MAETQHPDYIDTSARLESFCRLARKRDFIAVDTEFISERTYWPELCLVQLAVEGAAAVVDIKSRRLDIELLWELLFEGGLTKVFHASAEDVAIVYHATGKLPEPFFDTQLAAMFCGHVDTPGYAYLAKHFLNVSIDKSQQKTNWATRPLDRRQIDYALSDVTHLVKIYKKIIALLTKLERLDWVQSEHERLLKNIKYHGDPFESWRRIHISRPSGLSLAILREVAAWRDLFARKNNMPPGRVLGDNALAEIAMTQPRVENDLDKIRSLARGLQPGGSKRRGIWLAVQKAQKTPKEKWPTPIKQAKLPNVDSRLVELLKLVLSIRARDYKLAPSIITNSETLRAFIADHPRGDILTEGWRNEVFGQTATKFKQGRASIRHFKGQLIVSEDDRAPDGNLMGKLGGMLRRDGR